MMHCPRLPLTDRCMNHALLKTKLDMPIIKIKLQKQRARDTLFLVQSCMHHNRLACSEQETSPIRVSVLRFPNRETRRIHCSLKEVYLQ